jgi:hypothetical protein
MSYKISVKTAENIEDIWLYTIYWQRQGCF